MNHNKFLRCIVMIAFVIGIIHGIGHAARAAELSESFTTTQGSSTYTGEHFTITCSDKGDDDGLYLNSINSATISARKGEIISRVEFTRGEYDINRLQSQTGTVTINGDVATVSGVNATSLTINASSNLQIKAVTVYYTGGSSTSETYTITIPSTLTVSNSGWNALEGGLSVDLNLESTQKLTITASSNNKFNFVNSDDNSAMVAYYFLEGGDSATTYDSSKAQTSWEFTESGSKDIGIMVEDHSQKPAGTYKETVTFEASVGSNVNTLTLSGQYGAEISYGGNLVEVSGNYSFTLEYTDDNTWQDMVDKYDYIYTEDSGYGPDGKIIHFSITTDKGKINSEFKNSESQHNYKLVSVNDKVSAYTADKYYFEMWDN